MFTGYGKHLSREPPRGFYLIKCLAHQSKSLENGKKAIIKTLSKITFGMNQQGCMYIVAMMLRQTPMPQIADFL